MNYGLGHPKNLTYEECVNYLIHDCKLKGNGAVALFMGKKRWRELTERSRGSYKRVFRNNFVPYMIYYGTNNEPLLVLGVDRMQLALGLRYYCKAGKFSAIKRNQYVKRLLEGTFPDPNDQDELAMAMDLLTNPPSDIMDVL